MKTVVRETAETWVPHDYQVRARAHLLDKKRGCLFLAPGLGKTSVTISAFDELRQQGKATKMLIVAPKRVCQLVWRQEGDRWEQFNHLSFTFITGTAKQREELMFENTDIHLINPEGVAWLCDQYFKKKMPYDVLTIDELTLFKNGQASRSKRLLPYARKMDYVWGLTGTPAPNGYLDLFGQMRIVCNPSPFGDFYTRFRDRYFVKDFSGFNWTLKRNAPRQIEDAIAPYCLQMQAEDYLKMPDLIENVIKCEMPTKARKTYDEMKKDAVAELDEGRITAANAAAVLSKLKQMANGAVYKDTPEGRKVIHIHDAKIDALKDLIEEMNGQPILVAYEFNHDLARLKAALGDDTPHLGSGVTEKTAVQIEKDWNAGKIPVLLCHPQSVGHGLNFQRGNADTVCWFSLSFNYELYEQFVRRLYRQGNQSSHVTVHILVVDGTVDSKVHQAINGKRTTQNDLLAALKHELNIEEEDMALKRLPRRKAQVEETQIDIEDAIEEAEAEDQEEDEEEAPAPKKRLPRKPRGERPTTRQKLTRVEEPEEEEEDDNPLPDDDDDEAEGLAELAMREAMGDDTEEEEEVQEPVKPVRKPRARKQKASEDTIPAAVTDASYDHDHQTRVTEALVRAIESAKPEDLAALVTSYISLTAKG